MAKPIFDLQPMSIGDVLDRTIRLYRRHFLHNLGVVCIPHVLIVPLWALLSLKFKTPADPRAFLNPALLIPILLSGLAFVWLYFVSMGAMARSVSERFLGGSPTVWGAYAPTLRRGLPLIWACILVGVLCVGIGGGIAALLGGIAFVTHAKLVVVMIPIALVIVMVEIAFRMMLVTQTVVIDDARGFTALKRSWTLTKGLSWRIFVVFVFFSVVSLLLSFLIQFPAVFLAHMLPRTPGSVLLHSLKALSQVLGTPIGTIAFTLLYYDSRIRKEAFDLDVMAQELGRQPATTSPGRPLAPPVTSPELTAGPDDSAGSAPAPAPAARAVFVDKKTCPKCGTPFPPIQPNCPKCGTHVPYRSAR